MSTVRNALSGAWSTPIVLDCDCPSVEVVNRLAARPGHEGWLSPLPGLAGRIVAESMWVWLAPRGRNSFQAYFAGRVLSSGDAQSRLVGEVRMQRLAVAAVVFFLLIVALFLAASLQYVMIILQQQLQPVIPALLLVGLAFGFFSVALLAVMSGLRSFGRSRDDLVTHLRTAIGLGP